MAEDSRRVLNREELLAAIRPLGVPENVLTALRAVENQDDFLEALKLHGYHCMQVYLQRGGNPNEQIGRKLSLLSFAVELGSLETAKILLDSGADTNFGGKLGRFPLYLAVRHHGNMSLMALLIERGAQINQKYVNGNTPLLEATVRGEHEKVAELIRVGADIKAINNAGETGLHLAAAQGNATIVNQYIKAGLSVGVEKVEGFFRKKVSTGLQPLHLTAYGERGGHAHITKILLDNGADVNAAMRNGRTTLHLCAIRNAVNVADLLLDRRCHVNPISLENDEDKTPLAKAVDGGHAQMVEKLISAGADLETRDHADLTPLMAAAASGKVEMSKLLIQAGADVNAVNRKGFSVIQASKLHPPLITSLLVIAGCTCQRTVMETLRTDYPEWSIGQYDMRWLECLVSNPRSLMHCCRMQVRSVLGRPLVNGVKQLSLPQRLKDLVMFSELET